MRRALLGLLLLASCAPHKPASARIATEEEDIPQLGLTLQVPEGTEVSFSGGGATFFTDPEGRNPRVFSIEEWPSAPVHVEPASPKRTQKLPDGGEVDYIVQQLGDDGSGGAEAALSGAFTLQDQTFAIHCHDQAEPPAMPAPEWCFAWIGTARLARHGD